ncbi:MAG: hypothetical protein BGO39_15515 [Chloroflexi bacterium 54-19]|nr:MAG: hypothetical protein BGO39_15515 [Chloroflexi bacterium 54-19]
MIETVKNCIEVSNLTKIYEAGGRSKARQPIVANDAISLEINQGEVFGLLGPNGAGKTTLVNQILGLATPTEGSIFVKGIDIIKHPAFVKSLASYLPQRGIAFEYTEVHKALLFAGQLKGLTKIQAKIQSEQLIGELDLGEVADTFFNKLSGGMRRVVGLGLALMGRPEILVMDEPTNELDPVRRRRVWNIIQEINRERGITCILVTHNVAEAETVLQRVAIIDKGKVLALGTPGKLKQQISTEAFLDLTLNDMLETRDTKTIAEEVKFKLDQRFHSATLPAFRFSVESPNNLKIYLPFEQSGEVINFIVSEIGPQVIDDFKLAHTSLEDVYLHHVGPEASLNKSEIGSRS